MDLSTDTVLRGRYRITRLLGQGGMGAVYLAYDLALEHEAAVKVNRSPSPEAANQFIAEARLLASLRHPNLPRVIDYFLESQSQFLVMDYIPGEDLKSLVERMGALPLAQVIQWAAQLGLALAYLHHQAPPVFHRDVKPANLRLSPENEVILVDFGIAKTGDSSQATAAGATGYTPGYAPPEQYGTARTGPYSDQYSMAATLYHLLTGQKPADAVLRVLGQASLPPAILVNPALPQNVSLALERAMSVRPEDRFASVEEFVIALKDSDVQATVPQPAGEGFLAPGIGIPPAPPPPPAALPAAPPARRSPWPWLGGLAALVVLALAAWFLFGRGGPLAAAPPLPSATATRLPSVTSTLPPPTPLPPTATAPQKATATPLPSPTLAPTRTATLAPTQTPSPSPSPTTPPLLLGKSRSLAFVSDRADGKLLQVWTMKVTLNNQGLPVVSDFRQVTTDPGDKQHPAWSPDGKRLAYSAPGGAVTNGQDNGLDLFVIDLSQADLKPVNLTHRPGDDTEPAWSPDGKAIAFTNNGRGDHVRMIDVINADGSGLHRLSVDLEEFSPAWSPDGQWLTFMVLARENNIIYRRSKTDDFKTEEFFDNKAISGRTGQAADPVWSPDGTRLAYVKLELVGEGRLMSMDTATRGDKIVQLTSSGMERQPAWSPDSQWLAYSTRRDGNPEIYLMRATGQDKPVNLTNSPARDLWPAWQP